MRIVCCLVLIAACSSTASSAPSQCKRTDRHGNYLTHFTTKSGDCGAVPDTLVSFDAPSSNCTVDSQVWSDGDCKLDSTITCTATNGTTTKGTATTTQMNVDGSDIEGIASFQITAPSGICNGTYDVSYKRQ